MFDVHRSRSRRSSDTDRIAARLGSLSLLPTVTSNTVPAGQIQHGRASSITSTPLKGHECTAPSCAALEVFRLEELCAIIFSFLNTADVLNLRRVNTKWNDVTHKYRALRLHYFVRPQWNRPGAQYQLLHSDISGLVISEGELIDKGIWVEVTMTATAARQLCPDGRYGPRARSVHEGLRGLGRRMLYEHQDDRDRAWPRLPTSKEASGQLQWQDLFVTQPPLTGMQAFVSVSGASDAEPSFDPSRAKYPVACAKLHCDTGVTLGFLAETTLSLLSNDRGPAAVRFKAIMSFMEPKEDGQNRRRGAARSVIRIH